MHFSNCMLHSLQMGSKSWGSISFTEPSSFFSLCICDVLKALSQSLVLSVSQMFWSRVWALITSDLFSGWCVGWRLYGLMYLLKCQDFLFLVVFFLPCHCCSTEAVRQVCLVADPKSLVLPSGLGWRTLLLLLHPHTEFPFRVNDAGEEDDPTQCTEECWNDVSQLASVGTCHRVLQYNGTCCVGWAYSLPAFLNCVMGVDG